MSRVVAWVRRRYTVVFRTRAHRNRLGGGVALRKAAVRKAAVRPVAVRAVAGCAVAVRAVAGCAVAGCAGHGAALTMAIRDITGQTAATRTSRPAPRRRRRIGEPRTCGRSLVIHSVARLLLAAHGPCGALAGWMPHNVEPWPN